jgi:hypothetical protein
MKYTLTAQNLRILLGIGALLLVVGTATGFIFAQQKLQEFASTIIQLETDAKATNDSITTLQQLSTTLEGYKDVKQKAESITVSTSDYPVEVIKSITKLAGESNVKLTDISYGNDAAQGGESGVVPPEGTAAAPLPTAAGEPAASTSTPEGVEKKTINVSVESPVDYNQFMLFLKKIETNDTYLHVTKISMSKGPENTITVQPFVIEVYVK